MENKKKTCKGNYRSNYFNGCGELRYIEKYGLCLSCYREWCYSTGEGNAHLKKHIIPKAKKEVALKEKAETKKAKVDLMSNDQYRQKYVQPIINEIARLIDYGQPCIASGTYGKMAGGHYIAVGANRTTALNLHNIHIQSFHSNGPKGGDNLRYRQGIIETYGQDYLDKMNSLHMIDPLKLTKEDLKRVKKIAGKIRNDLKKNPVKLPPKARIRLRENINQKIGIYEPVLT